MTKYVPKKLTQLSANESAAIDTINKNLDSIKEHIDDSLSRTAKSPSQMQAALDMNGQKILNLGVPTEDTDVVRLKDVIENKEEIKQMVNTASVAVEKAMEAAETAEQAAVDMADQIQLAKDWATKTDGPVDDGEYSSKYYAEQIIPIASDISAVAAIDDEVVAVAGNNTNITAVANNATNINAVNANKTNINAVNSNKTNIDTVATNISNVNSVGSNISNVNTVAGNNSNVTTVATNISSVNTCASNISAIQNAPAQAAAAAASAELSAQYANDKINQTHISNCITEIPQDIKLELSSGVLTLKAGSKVYIPNGSGVFDTVTTNQDRNVSLSGQTATQQSMVFYRYDGIIYGNMAVAACLSGDSLSGTGSRMFYNTTTNKINFVSGGDVVSPDKFSLPLAVISISDGQVVSVDQVFNGFGYIGSTVFALPGVKYLVPNGRNADGTLKNTAVTVSAVKTADINNYTNHITISLNENLSLAVSNATYNEQENYNYYGATLVMSIKVADIGHDNNAKITSFVPKTAFHAVDYSSILSENNVFTGSVTLPFQEVYLAGATETSAEGGELQFLGGPLEPNAANRMRFDRYNGTFRFFGGDSSNTIRIPLVVDIENNKATTVTPASASDHTTTVPTTDWCQTMFANAVGTPRDITVLWGDGTGVNTPSEFQLSEDFTNFEQIAIYSSVDNGDGRRIEIQSTYWLDYMMNTAGNNSILLWYNDFGYTAISSYTHTTNPSTKTLFKVINETSVNYYIWGINRKVKNVTDPML